MSGIPRIFKGKEQILINQNVATLFLPFYFYPTLPINILENYLLIYFKAIVGLFYIVVKNISYFNIYENIFPYRFNFITPLHQFKNFHIAILPRSLKINICLNKIHDGD